MRATYLKDNQHLTTDTDYFVSDYILDIMGNVLEGRILLVDDDQITLKTFDNLKENIIVIKHNEVVSVQFHFNK